MKSDMNHLLRCHEIVRTDIVRGDGCYLYDNRGRGYLDLEARVWCAALGHNHPRVTQAIKRQLDRVMHLGVRYPNLLTEEAAMRALRSVGIPGGKCVFLSSGSEAVELGVRGAKLVSERPLLLTLSDSYLAAYGSAGSKNPDEWYCFDWEQCAVCGHSDECDADCERLEEIPFDRVGALIFEPGNMSGLVRLPPKQLIKNLAGQVKRSGGLVIVDEVTTGLGRTGKWYGFQHYDLEPDIVALGKGLGNGFPVSAVADVRGRGLMIAVEFKRGEDGVSAESIYRDLLDRGFIAGYNPMVNLIRFYPPLTIGEEDIARLLENLTEVLQNLG